MLLGAEAAALCASGCPTGVQPPATISPGQPRGHDDRLCGRTESDPAVTLPCGLSGAVHKPACLSLVSLAALGHWPCRALPAALQPRRAVCAVSATSWQAPPDC